MILRGKQGKPVIRVNLAGLSIYELAGKVRSELIKAGKNQESVEIVRNLQFCKSFDDGYILLCQYATIIDTGGNPGKPGKQSKRGK